jgi:hypothetical protein
MTKEELENNYTYKVVTRVLKKQFPFITDISVSDEDLSKYKRSIFLNISVNPFMIGQMFGVRVANYVIRELERGETYQSIYLSIMFGGSAREEMYELQELMSKVIKTTTQSSSIPHEMRVYDKEFSIGDFLVHPNTLPPDITTIPN